MGGGASFAELLADGAKKFTSGFYGRKTNLVEVAVTQWLGTKYSSQKKLVLFFFFIKLIIKFG